jgi:GNAT superfamily N-acetyltransferase
VDVFKMIVQNVENTMDTPQNYSIQIGNFNLFSEDDWKEFLAFDRLIEAEFLPGHPYSEELAKKKFLVRFPFQYEEFWIVRFDETNEIVGFAFFNILTEESPDYIDNGHQVRTWLGIHPDHRKKGLGTILVNKLCEKGLKFNKTEITFNTSTQPGQMFMGKFSEKSALESAENRLYFKNINWDRIESLHSEAKKKSPNVIIETFESISEEKIEEFAEVETTVLNDVPFGDLGLKLTITPDQIRKWIENTKKLGYIWLIKISKEQDGKISAMTDIKYHPLLPTIVNQGLTGVLREFRGRNLGMLLKTDMLLTIRERFPNVEFIDTGNADQNFPMLRINHELGFTRAFSWKAYKFQIIDLIAKINLNQYTE